MNFEKDDDDDDEDARIIHETEFDSSTATGGDTSSRRVSGLAVSAGPSAAPTQPEAAEIEPDTGDQVPVHKNAMDDLSHSSLEKVDVEAWRKECVLPFVGGNTSTEHSTLDVEMDLGGDDGQHGLCQ